MVPSMRDKSATEGEEQRWLARLRLLFCPGAFGGAPPGTWLRLLARHRFAVSPARLPRLAVNLVNSAAHSAAGGIQSLLFSRRIERTCIRQHPIFVIGHWRSGTTLLHELLTLDERHAFPTTYACMVPGHFLISEWSAPFVTRCILPRRRPVDDMPMSWDRPQEDEFALANLGVPSPYLSILFPNDPAQDCEYVDLVAISPAERERWKRAFLYFLKTLMSHDPRRLVLKSPLHTARIPTLLDIVGEAKFVHIVREPAAVFASTMHLWRTLFCSQGLQRPHYEGLHERVLATFEQIYERLRQTRHLVPPSRICDVRYEDLVADPVAELGRLYHHLDLGGFDSVRPRIEAYWRQRSGHRTNRFVLDDEVRALVKRRWGPYMAEYGYGETAAASSASITPHQPPVLVHDPASVAGLSRPHQARTA